MILRLVVSEDIIVSPLFFHMPIICGYQHFLGLVAFTELTITTVQNHYQLLQKMLLP